MDIGIVSVRYARALLKGATIAKQEDKNLCGDANVIQ